MPCDFLDVTARETEGSQEVNQGCIPATVTHTPHLCTSSCVQTPVSMDTAMASHVRLVEQIIDMPYTVCLNATPAHNVVTA